jgi:hypothetical protein
MELFIIYMWFAVTTAIYSTYLHFHPALQEAQALAIDNSFTRSNWMSYVVYFCVATLIAPVVLLAEIRAGDVFQNKIRDVICEPEPLEE